MSTEGIFNIRGNTKRLTATTGAMISAVKMSRVSEFPPAGDFIVNNFGPSVAFLGWGPDSDTAIANAKVPASGEATGTFCYVVHPGARSIEAKDGAYFAAMTESGTADIMITPGRGLVDGFGAGNVASDATTSAGMLALLAYSTGVQQELLEGVLIELRTLTHFLKEGLNVAEDPDSARSDAASRIN